VGSEVSTVKTDVAATKTELEKTVAELKRATGDLDGHSVLIATNGKELRLCARSANETISSSRSPSQSSLRRWAMSWCCSRKRIRRRNRYTIDLTADDKTVEKRDRGVNEPIHL